VDDKLDPNLFRYIWTYSRPQQIWILVIVLLSMPTYFLSLNIPKDIINGPIQGIGYETPGATTKVLPITIGNPFGDQSITIFSGFEVDRIGALVVLSLAFAGFVIINGLFKVYINTYKGRLSERMLRRLRFQLIDRILRFPLAHYRRLRSSEVATMIKDEVEPLGGFIGEAFAQPAFLIGQALTALLFIMLQSWMLGMVAIAVLIVQTALIPRLRARLRVLARERQLAARAFAGRISETVDGAIDIRLNDTTNFERSDHASRLGTLFFIRFVYYKLKFLIKFLNNSLAQLTPFIFYLGGGYLAIRGNIDIGQLVAVIAAYKELPAPIKELIDWDYMRLDVQVKYAQVYSVFDVSPLEPADSHALHLDRAPGFQGNIVFRQVSSLDDSGNTILNDVDVTIGLNERVALIGPIGGGAEGLVDLLLRIATPTAGTVTIGDMPLPTLPEWQLGRCIGYAGPEPFFSQGTTGDAILSALRHAPSTPAPEELAMSALHLKEAAASGNPSFDRQADWINYEAAGVKDAEGLMTRIIAVLRLVGLEDDVYALGLRSKLSATRGGTRDEMFLRARKMFLERLAASDNAADVEPFMPTKFSMHSSLLNNLVFGTIAAPGFSPDDIPENSPLWAVLAEDGMDARFYEVGREAASIIVDLFQDVSDNMTILERLDLIDPDELPEFESALRRSEGVDFGSVAAEDKRRFIRVAFGYTEPRHRLGLVNDELCQAVVAARLDFGNRLPEDLAAVYTVHDPDKIDPADSLQDNILFGRIADERSGAVDRVRTLLREILEELGLSRAVIELGLDYDIGTGGRRLSVSQRQQLGLARVLLKRPQLLIVNRGLSALNARNVEKVIDGVLELSRSETDGFGVLWVTATESHSTLFDRILTFDRGTLVADEAPNQSRPAA